jgi:two-component system chemotaxis sensor kinase CheA
MPIQDDETLQMYLEESLDHLSDIENDFLTIEENGADINEDLVNKVYRAAHSIKGGAGFMGLTNIKDLTHEMENILGKIRSREMIPTPDIVNILLKAADALKDLMEDIINSNEVDISGHVHALQAISEAGDAPAAAAVAEPDPQPLPETPLDEIVAPVSRPGANGTISLALPDSGLVISTTTEQVNPLFNQAKCVYLVEMDVARDIQGQGKTCRGVLEEMEQTGTIINANFALKAAAELDDGWVPDVPVMLFLFGSILKPDDINVLFEIDTGHISELKTDFQLYNLSGQPIGASSPILSGRRQSRHPGMKQLPSPWLLPRSVKRSPRKGCLILPSHRVKRHRRPSPKRSRRQWHCQPKKPPRLNMKPACVYMSACWTS